MRLHQPPFSAQLFNLIFDLVRTSATLRRQFAQTNGLLVFAQALRKSAPCHLNETLLNGILEAARYLTREILANSAAPSLNDRACRSAVPTFVTLLRQLFDQLLFAHGMWVRASIKVRTFSLCDTPRFNTLFRPHVFDWSRLEIRPNRMKQQM